MLLVSSNASFLEMTDIMSEALGAAKNTLLARTLGLAEKRCVYTGGVCCEKVCYLSLISPTFHDRLP